MGTVVEKVQYIEGTKQAIKKAIKNKGVEVSDTDTFRSYAEKIKEIGSGSGGGSSVAEYEYIKTGGIATYPETPYTEGASWFYTDANAYKEGNNVFNAYCGYASATALFDGNEETSYSPSDQKLFFNFNGKPLTKITLLVENTFYNNESVTLYGTKDIVYATSIDYNSMDKLYELKVPAYTTKTTFEIECDTDYKYFRLDTSDSRITIYSLSFLSDGTVIKMPLKTANMTPTLQGFSEDYMRVVTIPYYHNGDVVESQTLIFKPYEDGGCLVNYNDDGKATNLKLFLLNPTGEEVITEVPFVQPVLTENGTMGGDSFAVDDDFKSSEHPVWHAFDGDNSSYWRDANIPGYVDIYNPNPLVIKNIRWGFFYSYPTAGNVQGSNDGSDWELIKEWTNNKESDFDIDLSDNTKAFKYYRINISSVNMDVIHCSNLTITGKEIASVTYDKPIYVLAPDDDFELEGYSEKTQVADLNIPERLP